MAKETGSLMEPLYQPSPQMQTAINISMNMREIINLLDVSNMREKLITEGTLLKLSDGNDQQNVIENPSLSQIQTLINRSAYGEIKGLLSPDGQKLFAWDGDEKFMVSHHAAVLWMLNGGTKNDMWPNGEKGDFAYPPQFKNWFRLYFNNDDGVLVLNLRGMDLTPVKDSPILNKIYGDELKITNSFDY